jgi:hypothetical protein
MSRGLKVRACNANVNAMWRRPENLLADGNCPQLFSNTGKLIPRNKSRAIAIHGLPRSG